MSTKKTPRYDDGLLGAQDQMADASGELWSEAAFRRWLRENGHDPDAVLANVNETTRLSKLWRQPIIQDKTDTVLVEDLLLDAGGATGENP